MCQTEGYPIFNGTTPELAEKRVNKNEKRKPPTKSTFTIRLSLITNSETFDAFDLAESRDISSQIPE
jgi:hypothetical protein